MKKISFILGLVLAASFAMAQNSATISSIGNYQNATIDQGTGNSFNIGKITQLGNGNGVGDPTIAAIDQNSDNNTAEIKQTGFRLYGTVSQISNNTATIEQIGRWDGASAFLWGDNNHATIYQNGNQNSAYVGTLSDNNGTVLNPLNVYQDGNLNNARIRSGMASSSNYNLASIIQYGTNISTITQEMGDLNEAQVYQNGLVNNAVVLQEGTGNNSGYWLNSGAKTIYQAGDNNTATLNQLGDFNEEMIYQDGYRNTAIVNETGSHGYGYTHQKWNGSSDNYTEVQSSGDYNRHFTVQSYSNNSVIYVTQTGDCNESYVGQYIGNDNYARTTQTSDDNISNLTQNGSNNSATILQETGVVNKVYLTQNGGSDADIWQNGDHNTVMGLGIDPMGTSLNGSILDVDQYGSGNTLHLKQTNGASASVFQDGITNISVVIQN